MLRGRQIKFPITPKERQSGNFAHLVWPQIALALATVAGLGFAALQLARGNAAYSLGGLIANGFWSLNNILAMGNMIRAAFWKPDWESE